MEIRIRAVLLITLALMIVSVAAQAMPQQSYFCQDDCTLTYGVQGDPLSIGTDIDGSGRLLFWDTNQLVGWFKIKAQVSKVGQTNNGIWVLDFDTGTFQITSKRTGGTVLWAGNVDHFTIQGLTDGSEYSAASYLRPIYENEPTEFISVGAAKFSRTSGSWTDPNIFMDWIGNYNWNYDDEDPAKRTNIFGNLQAKLVVPEPSGLVALACGMFSLYGFCLRKRA